MTNLFSVNANKFLVFVFLYVLILTHLLFYIFFTLFFYVLKYEYYCSYEHVYEIVNINKCKKNYLVLCECV